MSCVHISTKDPADAERIDALLRGLGYRPVVDLAEAEGDVFELAARIAGRRYRLTPREREVLLGVLGGLDQPALAEVLGVSRSTIRGHLRNLEAKLDIEGSEAALRLVLHLDEPRWLHEPLRQQEALLRLVDAGGAVIAALERDDHRGLITAGRAPRSALVDGRREAVRIQAFPTPQQTGATAPSNPTR